MILEGNNEKESQATAARNVEEIGLSHNGNEGMASTEAKLQNKQQGM